MTITNGINEYCKPTDYFWGLIMNQIQDLCISCQSFTNVGPWSIYSRLLKILQCFEEHKLLIFYVKKKMSFIFFRRKKQFPFLLKKLRKSWGQTEYLLLRISSPSPSLYAPPLRQRGQRSMNTT